MTTTISLSVDSQVMNEVSQHDQQWATNHVKGPDHDLILHKKYILTQVIFI